MAAPARAAQHPIAATISMPFQTKVAFTHGPDGRVQNIPDIQQVIACR
jgi:hypothetical protein